MKNPPTTCPGCNHRKTMIDATLYVGDYHTSPPPEDHLHRRTQCVNCGAMVSRNGSRLVVDSYNMLPPRREWVRPAWGVIAENKDGN